MGVFLRIVKTNLQPVPWVLIFIMPEIMTNEEAKRNIINICPKENKEVKYGDMDI